jgi:hypothetical protein
MAKKSTSRPQTGVQPGLPKKIIPGTRISQDGLDMSFILTEDEKREENYKRVKELVYYYEWISRQQINQHRDKITKKYNLAMGIIDVDDYIQDSSEYEVELTMMGGDKLDYDLKFYPIIPNIVNTLVSERFKQHIQYSAIAVNREAVNQIIEQKNQAIRQLLLEPLQIQFNDNLAQQGITQEEQPDVYQQQMEIFNKLPQVQKYYQTSYRLEIEKWANHQLEIDNKRFKMRNIEKEALRNKIVADLPFVHVNLLENDYQPEVLDPRFCAYLRSPHTEDISEAMMFTWFEYESPLTLITKYGKYLAEEDISKLENLHTHYRTLLTIDTKARYNLDTPGTLEAAQNFLAFKETFGDNNTKYKDTYYRGDEYKERLVQVTNMYFQVPRKLGRLTLKSESEVYSTIVDDSYKVTFKPIYNTEVIKEKNEISLVNGEHIEWFYINELWRCVKINLSTNPNPDNSDDIFVVLEKFPVQIPKRGQSYGSTIPVHGGPTTNRYNHILSLVDKCKPWQVFYNYLWNRNDQLLKGEIGRFFAMNHNVIPQETMGEEWGPNNMLKWLLTARDLKVAPIDSSPLNTGQSTLSATGGYGQLVDLTVTNEVLEKAKLAEICKNECLIQVGVSPQFLGDISPSETATGVSQGINRSITQLKYLYEEHLQTMELARYTMLEFARYLAASSSQVEQMYVNDEGERIVFQIPSDLLIHDLGVYITSGLDENIILETIKQLALQDNTMGADAIDKISIMASKSVAEIYSKLKDASIDKQAKEEEMAEAQHKRQMEIIEKQNEQMRMQIDEESKQKQLDRENELRLAEIRAIGQAQFSEGGATEELAKYREGQMKEQEFFNTLQEASNQRVSKAQELLQKQRMQQDKDSQAAQLKREELQVKKDKIVADLEKSRIALKIAKENKP